MEKILLLKTDNQCGKNSELVSYLPTKTAISKGVLTVCINVDSALATSTNTSASKQCLSIQLSKSGETSIPGLQWKI